MTTLQPALCFEICGQRYAIPIDHVVEVAAMVEAARFSDTHDQALYGVIIRRGNPLMLIDLRHIFHCEEAPIELSTLFVVVQYEHELVGIIVDSVQGVVYFSKEVMRSVKDGYIQGVIVHEDTVIQWLAIDSILADILPDDVEI